MVLLNLQQLKKPKERKLAITQCNIKQLTFSFLKRRKLTIDFGGGEITSDAGLLLIRQADDSLGLVSGLTECINEKRDIRYMRLIPKIV